MKEAEGARRPTAFSQETLAERVIEALSQEILSGHLKPGERVDLNEYAALWGISIMPLRDAVKNLETQGFIKVRARRGVYVAQLTTKDVKDIFDVRIALECEAIRLAVPHIPPAKAREALELYQRAGQVDDAAERERLLPEIDLLVHAMAITYCDNPRLQALMAGLTNMVKWCQNTIIQNLEEPFRTTLPEHIAICEAICAGDVDGAVGAMREHLNRTSQRIEAFLS